MRALTCRVLAACALLTGGAAAGRADTLPPLAADQTEELRQAISLWSGGLLGRTLTSDQITATGDHYAVTVPMAGDVGRIGVRLEAAPITLEAKPLGAGRWTLDRAALLPEFHLIVQSDHGPLTFSMATTAKTYDQHAIVDPSLTTPSSFEMSASNVRSVTIRPPDGQQSIADTASFKSHADWQPAGNGRVDETATTRWDGFSSTDPARPTSRTTIGSLRLDDHIIGLSPRRLPGLMQAFIDVIASYPRPSAKPVETLPTEAEATLAGERRAALHGLLASLDGLGSNVDLTLAAEGISVVNHIETVGADLLSLSQTIAAPSGRADYRLRVELDGYHTSRLPPMLAADLVPTRFVIAPHVSGIPLDQLIAFLNTVIDADHPTRDSIAVQAASLLKNGSATLAIDELVVATGPALLAATGKVTATGVAPEDVTGSATISAKGFSELIKRGDTDPAVHRLVPVLIYLRGIGQQDSNGTVTWALALQNGKVTVNGTDLSKLVPGVH